MLVCLQLFCLGGVVGSACAGGGCLVGKKSRLQLLYACAVLFF
jgi:hypothetical protein